MPLELTHGAQVHNAWRREQGKEKANKVAQQVRRAAAELAVQSEKVSVVCDHPLTLHDQLAEHIAAPGMDAGG